MGHSSAWDLHNTSKKGTLVLIEQSCVLYNMGNAQQIIEWYDVVCTDSEMVTELS